MKRNRQVDLIGNVVAYVRFAAVFSGVLGVLHQTRLALQGLGAKREPPCVHDHWFIRCPERGKPMWFLP